MCGCRYQQIGMAMTAIMQIRLSVDSCVRPLRKAVVYPGILFGGGVQQVQLRTEDRENRHLGAAAPLVRGSGGSCYLVQEISSHIVKFS